MNDINYVANILIKAIEMYILTICINKNNKELEFNITLKFALSYIEKNNIKYKSILIENWEQINNIIACRFNNLNTKIIYQPITNIKLLFFFV